MWKYRVSAFIGSLVPGFLFSGLMAGLGVEPLTEFLWCLLPFLPVGFITGFISGFIVEKLKIYKTNVKILFAVLSFIFGIFCGYLSLFIFLNLLG